MKNSKNKKKFIARSNIVIKSSSLSTYKHHDSGYTQDSIKNTATYDD